MLLRFVSLQTGLFIPIESTLVFFLKRNAFKIATIVNFVIFVLGLFSMRMRSMPAKATLKRLLLVISILRYIRVDSALGEIQALSLDEFTSMIHILVILCGLEMSMYD